MRNVKQYWHQYVSSWFLNWCWNDLEAIYNNKTSTTTYIRTTKPTLRTTNKAKRQQLCNSKPAARIVYMQHNRVSALKTLRELHWLSIAYRKFYLLGLLDHHQMVWHWLFFCVRPPLQRVLFHTRLWNSLWNSLPAKIRNCVLLESVTDGGSLREFKKLLKTYLFKLALLCSFSFQGLCSQF